MLNSKCRFRFFALLGTGLFFAGWPLQAAPPTNDAYTQATGQLKSKDPNVRRQGAEALGRLRNPAATDALKKLLTDEVPSVRVQTIEALGLMRVVAVSSDIARILATDKDPGVRQMAAISLGYIADPNTVPALIRGLKDAHEGTRFASVNSLGILRNDAAAAALAQELRSPDSRMRNSCAYALGNIASRLSVPALMDLVKVSLTTVAAANEGYLMDAGVGASAIRSLGLIGDPSAVPAIKKHLSNKDKKVQVSAAQSLLKMGDLSGLPVARLGLNDPDGYNRRISADMLGEAGDANDLVALKKIKGEKDESLNQSVAAAIEKITRRTAPAKPAAVKKTPPAPSKK